MKVLGRIFVPTFVRKSAVSAPFVFASFYVALAFFLLCVVIGIATVTLHLILNVTPSMPQGFYQQFAYRHGILNEIVSVCESAAAARVDIERTGLGGGTCRNGDIPLLKFIVGYAGDTVVVTPASVTVNGSRLPHSAAVGIDRYGNRLHADVGVYHLHAGQVWLYTPHTHSFDSRYYGPVSESLIRKAERPFWTYRTKEFDSRYPVRSAQ